MCIGVVSLKEAAGGVRALHIYRRGKERKEEGGEKKKEKGRGKERRKKKRERKEERERERGVGGGGGGFFF